MRKRLTCAECGIGIVQQSRGRPSRYCGAGCRRSAEYNVRRVQGLIRRSQQKVQDAGLRLALHADNQFRRPEAQKTLAFWQAEVTRLEIELRELLAGTTEHDTAVQEGA